jgi:hypothetical protein
MRESSEGSSNISAPSKISTHLISDSKISGCNGSSVIAVSSLKKEQEIEKKIRKKTIVRLLSFIKVSIL